MSRSYELESHNYEIIASKCELERRACVFTSDGAADAVQVSDVGVGGVDLVEVLLHLTVVMVTKLQRRGRREEEEEEEER